MDYVKFTDQGKREVNEDYCSVSYYDEDICFVLADGLGGHGGGEIASSCAVSTVCRLFAEKGFYNEFFRDAFTEAQAAVLQKQKEYCAASKMKTTMVILVIHGDTAQWAHVGDSRLYHFSNGKLKKRTLDHSVPQMLVMTGDIKESEIRHHQDRNRLLRVIGIQGEEPRFEIGKPVKLKGRTQFLLCTDGYWELIEEADMMRIAKECRTADQWVEQMNQVILRNGGDTDMDNYSAIAVWDERKGGFFFK